MALMTLPLAFSLLCDKNLLFGAKRIAGLRCYHKPTERQLERMTENIEDCSFFWNITQVTLQLTKSRKLTLFGNIMRRGNLHCVIMECRISTIKTTQRKIKNYVDGQHRRLGRKKT